MTLIAIIKWNVVNMAPGTGNEHKILDATGLLCPLPVLRTRRLLDEMTIGESLTVKASDPASVHDMPAFCKMSGNILKMAKIEEGVYIFEIEKAAPEDSDHRADVIPIRPTPVH